jgi:predicted nucleic acid-binding protein
MTAKAFIDTNIYIYALTNPKNEEDGYKRDIALSVLGTLIASQAIITSTQVLNEFHSVLIKKFKQEDATVFKMVEQNILSVSLVSPINYQTYQSAYQLRTKYSVSYWDSLIIASALENDCSTLYSEDMQHELTIENKLSIINPFQI